MSGAPIDGGGREGDAASDHTGDADDHGRSAGGGRDQRGGPAVTDRLDALGRRFGRAAFGDRFGAALFLGALCFFALFWRVEVLSTDNYANLNALVALADGRLHVVDPAFGPASGETPGMRYVDGRRVADNYGLVVLSLPALLALRAAALAVDLRVALAAVWCLGLLAAAILVGDATGRERAARSIGAGVAGVAFTANLAVATPFPTRWLPLLALQSTTMVAAALTAVALYRLGRELGGDRRIGLAAGAATAAATPVGFWAVGPKQHAVTALFLAVALYGFYRSRAAPTARGETYFRAAAYACVGLTAWQHSGEALLLGLALVPVDLATARHNGPRRLAVVAAALALSLVPALLTNAAVAGDPLQPLKLLPPYRGQELIGVDPGSGPEGGSGAGGAGAADDPGGASGSAGSGGAGTGTGGAGGEVEGGGTAGGGAPAESAGGGGSGGDGAGVGDRIAALASLAASLLSAVVGLFDRGVSLVASRGERSLSALADPRRVRVVFLRSGYVASLRTGEDVAINLSVLESMPLVGALAALPAAALRRLSNARRATASPTRTPDSPAAVVRRLRRPERATDAVAVAYALLLVGTTFDALPLHHMLTVRYLHGLYPLAVYGLLRSRAVRATVAGEARRLSAAYLATVAVGVVLYVAAYALLRPSLGEAVQLYGLVACCVGVAAAAWGLLVAASDRVEKRRPVGAVALGVAGATSTVYLLVAAGLFSATGRLVLPLSRTLVRALFTLP